MNFKNKEILATYYLKTNELLAELCQNGILLFHSGFILMWPRKGSLPRNKGWGEEESFFSPLT